MPHREISLSTLSRQILIHPSVYVYSALAAWRALARQAVLANNSEYAVVSWHHRMGQLCRAHRFFI